MIAEHEGVVTCAVGTQVCAGGVWGECSADEIVTKQADGFELHALSTPAACMNNPCDPSCMFYDEVPAMAITSTPLGPRYPWSSGGTPPAGTNTTPCQDASDCQGDSYCVNPATSASCGHNVCETGAPLVNGCDPCVSAVCAANPSCCQQGTACATAFGTAPGFVDCTGSSSATTCQFAHSGSQSCDALCAAGGGTCQGAWNDYSTNDCSPDVAQAQTCATVFGSDAICRCSRPGTGSWDATCFNLVQEQCGALCESDVPAGECVPWAPGEHSNCGGYDLTVGVGCTGTVVVCNRGDVEAPAGVQVSHYPQADGAYAVCDPTPLPLTASSCVTSTPIPAGECIDVTSCVNLTTGPQAIWVSPPTSECDAASCLNNWALWNPVACGTPSCAVTYVAPPLGSCQLAVPFEHDMTQATSLSYDNGVDAAQAMVEVSGAAACTGSVLEWYWADAAQTIVQLCPAACSNMLEGSDQCDLAGEEYYDAASDRCYQYSTTLATWATQRAACQAWGGDLAAITSQAEQSYVATNVLALETAGNAFMAGTDVAVEAVWAWATGEPWVYAAWAAAEPAGGANPRDCLAADQAGAWHDVSCDLTYRRLCERGVLPKTIVISKPCPQLWSPAEYFESYEPTCPSGQGIQWGFLGWDSDTPAASSISLSFRTAFDVAGLSSATWVPAGTAQRVPNTQVCPIGSSCATDLFTALGGLPGARYPVGEIRIRTVPDGVQAPTMNSWTITYSCVDDQ